MNDLKAGVKTSEFWLNLIVALGGMSAAFVQFQKAQLDVNGLAIALVGIITAFFAAIGYARDRAGLKSQAMEANSQ